MMVNSTRQFLEILQGICITAIISFILMVESHTTYSGKDWERSVLSMTNSRTRDSMISNLSSSILVTRFISISLRIVALKTVQLE